MSDKEKRTLKTASKPLVKEDEGKVTKASPVVAEEKVGLKEFADTNAGTDILLMAGFVSEEVKAGNFRDSQSKYRERFEIFKTKPVK